MSDFKLILSIAALWLIGGMTMGAGIRAYFAVEWILPCGSLSLLFGMLLLLLVMQDEQARRRLYGEAQDEIPFKIGLAALIIIPITLIVAGLFWLLTAPLLPY